MDEDEKDMLSNYGQGIVFPNRIDWYIQFLNDSLYTLFDNYDREKIMIPMETSDFFLSHFKAYKDIINYFKNLGTNITQNDLLETMKAALKLYSRMDSYLKRKQTELYVQENFKTKSGESYLKKHKKKSKKKHIRFF